MTHLQVLWQQPAAAADASQGQQQRHGLQQVAVDHRGTCVWCARVCACGGACAASAAEKRAPHWRTHKHTHAHKRAPAAASVSHTPRARPYAARYAAASSTFNTTGRSSMVRAGSCSTGAPPTAMASPAAPGTVSAWSLVWRMSTRRSANSSGSGLAKLRVRARARGVRRRRQRCGRCEVRALRACGAATGAARSDNELHHARPHAPATHARTPARTCCRGW
jgi:hypothetical protein